MQQTVRNDIGEDGVADDGVPVFDWALASDHGMALTRGEVAQRWTCVEESWSYDIMERTLK